MISKIIRKRSGMAFNIIGGIVFLLLIFGLIVSLQGYISFTKAFEKEYSATTYHMADTAAHLVNGDNLNAYMKKEKQEEYQRTRRILDGYCKRMSVSLIYVIQVDTSDYGRFVSIFNAVDNSVDDSEYKVWEMGHKRDTTNDEYRMKYKAIYDKKVPYETVYRTRPTDGQHPHITTMVPVMDSNQDVAAILCVQRPVRELNDVRYPYLIKIAFSTLLLALIASLFVASFIRKNFVAPIGKVSEEASRFARENTIGSGLRNISKYTEIDSLTNSIDKMETDMVDYIEKLTTFTAERERIGAELALASTIQENSIPSTFPPYPGRTDFDIYATMTPAKEIGGDFYNFFLIDDDHLGIVIGDVSGKGIPAALFMMVTNIVLSNRAKMGGTPAEVLAFVNDSICKNNKADMFVSVWLGIVEISTGKIIAANAGHEDAMICKKGGDFEMFKTKHNMVVGAMEGLSFKNFEISLMKGDKIFLYTDGIPEASDSDYNMYTKDRLIRTLNLYKTRTPKEILEGVHRSVDEFAGDAQQFDDLTMLCLELST